MKKLETRGECERNLRRGRRDSGETEAKARKEEGRKGRTENGRKEKRRKLS